MPTIAKKPPASKQADSEGTGSLTITATPIGNLGDIGARAREALAAADIIACEDTRHTGRMLKRLGIAPQKLIAYHDHSHASVRANLLAAMGERGAHVVLVSDAGTPLICDPGWRLVREAHGHAIPVTTIPGPSAILAGLAVAGLATDRFYFGGFVANTAGARQRQMAHAMGLDCTAVFYESPRRLAATLKTCAAIDPARAIVIAREMTKLHEQIIRGEASVLAETIAARTPPLKGEVVLLIDGAEKSAAASGGAGGEAEVMARRMLRHALAGGMSRRDAAKMTAALTGMPRGRAYDLALAARDDDKA